MFDKETLIPRDLAYPVIEISCNHTYKNLVGIISGSKCRFSEEYMKIIWRIQKYHSKVPEVVNPLEHHFSTKDSTFIFVKIMSVNHEKENPYYQYINGTLDKVYDDIENIKEEYKKRCRTETIDANKLVYECDRDLFIIERNVLHSLYTRSANIEHAGHVWFTKLAIEYYSKYWNCNKGIWIDRTDFINTFNFLNDRLNALLQDKT